MLRVRWLNPALLLAVPLVPGALSAQESIRGIVAEIETADPIGGAVVSLLGSDSALHAMVLSDSLGWFEVGIPRVGSYVLRVNRIGYQPTRSGVIAVPADAVVEVRVNLTPDPLMLEAVTVRAAAPLTPELRGFYKRRDQRRGYQFTRADLERLNATMVAHVLTEIPGYRKTRGGISLNFRRCRPAVFVDGYEPLLPGLYLGSGLPIGHVHGVEVFRNWSDVPGEFALPRRGDARCGVILIWTVAVER